MQTPRQGRIEADSEYREEIVEFEIFENEHFRKVFKVHRVLLKAYAPSLDSLFRYPGIKSIKLTDISVENFDVFIGWLRYNSAACRHLPFTHWLHIRTLDPTVMGDAGDDHFDQNDPLMWDWDNGGQPHLDYTDAAIEMYIFASAYEIPRLRQDAIDRVVWCYNQLLEVWRGETEGGCFTAARLNRAYDHTQAASGLRALLKEGYCKWGKFDRKSLAALPKDLLVEVCEDVYRSPDVEYGPWTPCDFHEHASRAEKVACDVRILMDRGWLEAEE
jgi:hypothetical protein